MKLFLQTVFSLFLITSSLALDLSSLEDGRIVGGLPTDIKHFPFQVSLQAEEWPYHLCGGSIIDDRWILTAAHCTQSNYTFYVRVGSTYTYEGGYIFEVSRVYIHPNFTHETFNSDISLLELSEPITVSTRAAVIDLPEQNEHIPEESLVTVSGWGATMDWTITDDALRYVHVYILNSTRCAKNFSEIGVSLFESMFCAGYPGGGRDACSGDSGGPVIFNDKVVGIVSTGTGCADEKFPGIYTKVSLFRDWIYQITGI